MEQCSKVFYGEQIIGTAHMDRQGLYVNISCRCRLPDDGIYKLYAMTEAGSFSLGVLCPVGGAFGLDTKIPYSRLGQGSVHFSLTPKAGNCRKILMEKEMPFAYLRRLEQCRFLPVDGKAFLTLPWEKSG